MILRCLLLLLCLCSGLWSAPAAAQRMTSQERLAQQLLNSGLSKMSQGNCADAIPQLQMSINLAITSQALYLLGQCYELTGQHKLARETYQRIPGRELQRIARRLMKSGLAKMSEGRYLDAASELRRSFALRANSRVLLLLGQCYELAGKRGQAREVYRKLLAAPDAGGLDRKAIEKRLAGVGGAASQPAASQPAASQPAASQPADQRARDEAIFAAADEPDEPAQPGKQEEQDELLGGRRRLLDLGGDKLQVGGLIYLRFNAMFASGGLDDQRVSMPNLVDVYLDAQPSDRVRGFFRGRLRWDPTVDEDDALVQLTGAQEARVELDELWIKLDLARRLFVTVGQQKVRWGATRLWNPVDAVNPARRPLLDPFDDRNGVPALKLHLPVESLGWNFYLLGLLDKLEDRDRAGGVARIEVVISTAEVGLTGAYVTGDDPRLGLDLSAGIWRLELAGELGLAFDGRFANNAALQAALGLEYQARILDNDRLLLGGEWFYNGQGSGEVDPLLLLSGEQEYFYAGRQYAALYVSLPGPGSLDDWTFLLSGVSNLSDLSLVLRFDLSVKVLRFLTVRWFIAAHMGEQGELRIGDAAFPAASLAQARKLYSPDDPARPIPTQQLDTGLWISLDL